MRKLLAVLFFAISLTPAAHATSGPGCLIVTNVADDDALNMRSRPSASPALSINWCRASTALSIWMRPAAPSAARGPSAGAGSAITMLKW